MTDTTILRVTPGATTLQQRGSASVLRVTQGPTIVRAIQGIPGTSVTLPLTTAGDLLGYNGANARFPVGTDDQILIADSGEAFGFRWAAQPVASPLTTKGDLYGFDTADARLPVGTDGQFLRANSTPGIGLEWATFGVGDIPAHASTHLPAGSDPLATATAVELTDATNAEGVAESFARSDHAHSHGSRAGGLLHAVATVVLAGFMSAADKAKIDAYPSTPAGIDHNALTNLAVGDVHTQYAFLAGRAAADQTLIGSTLAAGQLVLTGSTAADGLVAVTQHLQSTYDTTTVGGASPFAINWGPTMAASGTYIGGVLSNTSDTTVTTGIYIPATFSDTSIHRIAAVPAFSAHTWANVLARFVNLGNFDLTNSLVINVGITHERATVGTSSVANVSGMSFSPQLRASVSGAVMTRGDAFGLRTLLTGSSVVGSTLNFGRHCAVQVQQPSAALFQPFSGTHTLTLCYGINYLNFTGSFAGADNVVVRSLLTANAAHYFLRNIGGAQSDFGGGFIINAGLVQVLSNTLGLSLGSPGGSVQILWDGTREVHDPIVGDNLRIAYATNLHTVSSASVSEDSAIAFNYPKGSFGEGGTPGNNKWRWVANAETITIGGDFTQFLYTQLANDTIDAAISTYAGLTFNAPTPVIGSGSVVTVAGVNVGGNPTVGTNRVGVRVISNPTGGGGVNAALWITAGRSQFDGFIDINKPVALGGGAAATLGTIGGAGPTAAAQAQWVEIEVNGVRHWVAAWT